MKNYFNNNSIFKNVYVKGEVAGKFESSIHHLYFDLKDKESYIPCVIYRWNRNKIGFEVENGMQLLVTANVILYPPQAKMELDIQSATDDGLGRLHIAYQQLKKKLNEEGLFDVQHKKELPKFPKKIGVVTSVGGLLFMISLRLLKRDGHIVKFYYFRQQFKELTPNRN